MSEENILQFNNKKQIRIDKDPELVKTEILTGKLLSHVFYAPIEDMRQQVGFVESKTHAGKVVDIILNMHDVSIDTLMALNGITDYTIGHSVNVCVLSIITGHALGYTNEELVRLGTSAVLHDIGKRFISKEMLYKPTPFTTSEMGWMQQHPQLGYDFAKKLYPEASQDTMEGILYHHERLNGGGYLYGLREKQIPEFARIIAVCDVFEAFTAKRPYHEKREISEGIAFLQREDGMDPMLVKVFVDELKRREMKPTVALTESNVTAGQEKADKKKANQTVTKQSKKFIRRAMCLL